ncbi:MAG: DoxX family protein [bacterium]
MLRTLLRTDKDISALVLRVLLGIVFFPHGAQKVLGWFGGHGFAGTMNSFTGSLGIPALFAFLAIMAEFLGALGLIVGLLTRVAAFGIACVMAVAVYMIHFQNGFFMNWFGDQKGEGFEYHILAAAIALALMIKGGGLWSMDRALSGKIRK